LLLVGAEEIFLIFVLQTWLTGWLVGVMRGFGIGSTRVDIKWLPNRFSIGSMLFLTGVSAGAIVLWQVMPTLNRAAWVSLIVCGLAMVSFAVSGWLVVNLAWRWYWRISLALALALAFSTLPACFDWLVLSLFKNAIYWPPDFTYIGIFYPLSNLPTFD